MRPPQASAPGGMWHPAVPVARYGPKPHGSPKMQVWRHHPGAPGTGAALSSLSSSTPVPQDPFLGAGDASPDCQGSCGSAGARSHLRLSRNCWPSLRETLLRSVFRNCRSICLTPGAGGEVIYSTALQATAGNVLLQPGKLLLLLQSSSAPPGAARTPPCSCSSLSPCTTALLCSR